MNKPMLRIGAVVFSAGLLIGFVLLKAGMFSRSKPAIPASRVFFPTTTTATTRKGWNFDTFGGSKSARVLKPTEVTPAADEEFTPVLLPGSKSVAPVFNPPASLPTSQPNQ